MKHSNIYYISKLNKAHQVDFIEVDGIAVKNSFGFDLFKYKHPTKSHYVIYEGMTGVKICAILPGDKGDDYVTSHKEIDAFLAQYHQIDKIYKHDRIRAHTEQMKEKGILTPRYTEPDKRRLAKKRETNPDTVFSKCLYKKGKKYFVRVHNQERIQLFKRKDSGNDSHFTVYAPCNGWMITLEPSSSIDEHISKLKDRFDIHAWVFELFERQIANPKTWVDVGIADYLNRRDEADVHNAPIKAAREEKSKQDTTERENKLKAQEQEKTDKYNTAISNAVSTIRNNELLSNDDIETLTGNVTSIILELMKIYHIEVPLKTKGWINAALACIFYKDGAYTYSYYAKSRNSIVFQECLNKLVYAINELF